ncbi:hypothetical protein DL98DRAFT_640311 [Cadophora sp. DSE1049]|nr:hypothetical protein DL98DRAFT_640311 [Cadophora sp. DSE1049]
MPEQERQALLDDRNNVREGIDSSQLIEGDQRRDTRIDLEKIIADRLASTFEGRATEDLEALVPSYQKLIGTGNVDTKCDRQQDQQALDRQLQILPAAPTVRIEFRIRERDGWRTDQSLLVDLSDPSEVERVAKEYMGKGIRPFDSSLNLLVPRTCFQAATADRSNTILLMPEDSMEVNNSRGLPTGARQNRGRHSG